MKKLNKLKDTMQLEKNKKQLLVMNIESIQEEIADKLKAVAEGQNNDDNIDDLLSEIKQLKEQKETEKVKLDAFETRESNLQEMARDTKNEYLAAKKEYQKKIDDSLEVVKELKRKFNDDIKAIEKERINLSNELSNHRIKVKRAIENILSEKEVREIGYTGNWYSNDIKKFKIK